MRLRGMRRLRLDPRRLPLVRRSVLKVGARDYGGFGDYGLSFAPEHVEHVQRVRALSRYSEKPRAARANVRIRSA